MGGWSGRAGWDRSWRGYNCGGAPALDGGRAGARGGGGRRGLVKGKGNPARGLNWQTFVLFSHKTYYMITINEVCDRVNFIQSHRNNVLLVHYIRQ